MTATPHHTITHVMLSGAFHFPWYVDHSNNAPAEAAWRGLTHEDPEAARGWQVTVNMTDPADFFGFPAKVHTYVFDHETILATCRKIIDGAYGDEPGPSARKAAIALLENPEAARDIDGSTADDLIQLAAFGRIAYS